MEDPLSEDVSRNGMFRNAGHDDFPSLKVLHILWCMDIGGAERAVFQLVREQIRCGLHADVLVGGRAGFYGKCAREAGAIVHELGQRRVVDLRRARSAGSIIRGYDVAHFHGREPVLMAIARRQNAVRLVYTHRSGLRPYSRIKRLRHHFVARSLGGFQALSANTRQSARAAAEIFGIPVERFEVIYNGIDFTLLEPVRPPGDVLAELGVPIGTTIVGTCAKLLPWKRIDRLVRAAASLRSQTLHCLILGDGSERRALERLAQDLGVSHRVTFAGLQESVRDYLQIMDVFVLPSGPDEGFGNSLVEAMAVGIPSLVFSDGGGLLEHVSDRRTGMVAGDQADLEQRLAELIDDPGLRRRIGDAGRQSVRAKYRLEDTVDSYLHLYATT